MGPIKLSNLFFLFASLLLAQLIYAQDTSNLSELDAQKEIAADITELAKRIDSSVPQDVREQLIADFKTLGSIRGGKGSNLQHDIFHGPVHGLVYLRYLLNNTEMFSFKESRPGAVAQAENKNPFNAKDTITVFRSYTENQLANRLGSLIHEATHLATHMGHDECIVQDDDKSELVINDKVSEQVWTKEVAEAYNYGDTRAICDHSIMGAFGAQAVFLGNLIENCKNCQTTLGLSVNDLNWELAFSLRQITDEKSHERIFSDVFSPEEQFQLAMNTAFRTHNTIPFENYLKMGAAKWKLPKGTTNSVMMSLPINLAAEYIRQGGDLYDGSLPSNQPGNYPPIYEAISDAIAHRNTSLVRAMVERKIDINKEYKSNQEKIKAQNAFTFFVGECTTENACDSKIGREILNLLLTAGADASSFLNKAAMNNSPEKHYLDQINKRLQIDLVAYVE